MSRRHVVVCFLLAFVALVSACSSRVPLYAPPTTLPSGVFIKVTDAYVRGDRIYVKTWMMNGTRAPISIDRDGFALRLPDGRVLPRADGTFTRHTPYQLAPGAGRDVHVDFKHDGGFEGLRTATLVVGGISFGTDPMPRVAGEVALTDEYSAPPSGAAPPAPAPAPAPAPPPTPQAAAQPPAP